MILSHARKMVSSGSAAVAVSCFGFLLLSGATVPDTAPNVTITAAGTFASPAGSGADSLKLSGEPFTISIVAKVASAPVKHGRNWAVFSPLKMTGTVHSGLIGSTPVNIASTAASILQIVGPSYDIFETAFPVKVVGISLTIKATVTVPSGTIPKQLIHPFASVALTPSNATVIYSDSADSTTLAIQTGTLVSTLPNGSTGGPAAGVRWHANRLRNAPEVHVRMRNDDALYAG